MQNFDLVFLQVTSDPNHRTQIKLAPNLETLNRNAFRPQVVNQCVFPWQKVTHSIVESLAIKTREGVYQ